MYLEYWGLKKPPFANVPDSRLFFQSNQHEEALARMLYAVKDRNAAAMLTGEVGSGKTTISRVLRKQLEQDRYDVKIIVNPALNSIDLIRAILLQLGDKAEENSKTILLDRMSKRLTHNMEKGLTTVLIIDEAHLISDPSSFEELRMLLNLQTESHFLVCLILLGLPLLAEKVSQFKPLKERIAVKYNLRPLSINDTIRYILFRLKISGAQGGIFTKDAVNVIYKYSSGIPLKINNICERSLLLGMMIKARTINTKIVKKAIEDLD